VSSWTDGYVAEIEYTFGYYGELNPYRAAMPFLNMGLVPPTVATACELGYGQGITINIHAAASPVAWYGTDFLPAHAAFAQSLAEIARSGAQLFDQSFAEFCTRSDLPDFDYIALHGIYSWISDENQRIIVDFLRRKLKPGGILYISYNTLPGFAPTGPLQHMFYQHAETMAPPGQGVIGKIDAALEFADRMLALNPAFATANPSIAERVRLIKGQNRNYVAHEYLNDHWRPLPFAEIAKHLAPAKLNFACSAHYLDHVDALNLTPEQRRFMMEIPDAVFRQTVRDFLVNQQFRRDYWVKGGRRLAPLEQAAAIRGLRVMLVGNRSELTFSVSGSLGQREMSENIYNPILDALGTEEAKTIGEIEQALSGTETRLSVIYEALMVLAGKGDVVRVQDEAIQEQVKRQTDRLNLCFFEKARNSGDMVFLASPLTGGAGIAAGRFHQLFLLALRQGTKGADELAQFAWDILASQGQRVAKDNKALETPEENLAELATQAGDFLEKRLPLFRKFQIA
jgi:hypothetical protein